MTSIADVVLPKYRRRQPEFDAAVVESYLLGHSTRKSTRFLTGFLGELGISHTTVSRILQRLDERAAAWRKRPLDKPFVYLWLDAKYARIHGATKRPYAVLFAYGATQQGERELLGFQIQRSEGTAHWECMLNHLVSRGLDPQRLKLVIRDENSGCDEAILTILGEVPQQACAVHLERNIANMVSRPHRRQFQNQLSEVFKQPSELQARRHLNAVFETWEDLEHEACTALRARVDRSLVFYRIATSARWRAHLKSTNLLERFYYAFAYDYNQRAA